MPRASIGPAKLAYRCPVNAMFGCSVVFSLDKRLVQRYRVGIPPLRGGELGKVADADVLTRRRPASLSLGQTQEQRLSTSGSPVIHVVLRELLHTGQQVGIV